MAAVAGNLVRPLYAPVENFNYGFSKGFFGIDYQNPLYCFNDGIKVFTTGLKISAEFAKSGAGDVGLALHILDSFTTFIDKCVPTKMTGVVAALNFYFSQNIVDWYYNKTG